MCITWITPFLLFSSSLLLLFPPLPPPLLLPFSSFLLPPPFLSPLLPSSPQIQLQRVDCIKQLFFQGEIYVKATVGKVMAALRCRGAEMKVDYLMTQYRQAKRESDNAEVRLCVWGGGVEGKEGGGGG